MKESSISVAVRIRPLTNEERLYLDDPNDYEEDNEFDEVDEFKERTNEYDYNVDNKENILRNSKNFKNKINDNNNNFYAKPFSIKKIVDVVDDRMLIFDPKPINYNDELDSSNGLISNKSRKKSGSFNSGIGNHNKRHKEHKFIFDRLFDETSTQEDIYNNTTRPSIEAVLDGYNSTVFAYGATGCGKTYTISGTPENPGIIFLAVKELFYKIENQNEKDITVEVSYLEIYNETIKDLLNINMNSKKLTLLENENKEIIVSNLTKIETKNVEDVMDVIIKGNYNRTVSPTEANLTSSRSHAVLQVYITQTPHISDIYEKSTKSVLSIIDLAGSERASATKNKGIRLHEGANINKSLLALGNCINALCDIRKSTHIPYRDSKLTRLLKFSLGGNCKTIMIVCISPSSRHYDETLNALKFANRAKEIKTKVIKNQTTVMKHVGSYMKIISDQKRRIYELETLMDSTVKREISKHIENRNAIQSQIDIMIERLWNNVKKCEHLKADKIYIVAKRKLIMIYIKQLKDFYNGLNKFDIDDHMKLLKQNLNSVIENMKAQIISLEAEYVQRTDLDTILIETSESFLKKLRELNDWNENDEKFYKKEIEYLKTIIERQIFYESSVLFDSWIEESENIGNIDSIPNILAQYICMIENIANNLQTVEDARMKCYQLSDSMIQSCTQQLGYEIDDSSSNINNYLNNNKKRKNSGNDSFVKDKNIEESSFIRQGNRISSINNKLMRINLNSVKDYNTKDDVYSKGKEIHNDSLSEIESSLILENDNNKQSKEALGMGSLSQSIFLQSESTPQKEGIVDNLNGFMTISPDIGLRIDEGETIKSVNRDFSNSLNWGEPPIFEQTEEEIDESNNSVIIRKVKDDGEYNSNNNNDNNHNKTLHMSVSTSPSKYQHQQKSRSKSGKLTAKKLTAAPNITSPHRLAGLDSSSNLFQLKLRESLAGGTDMFGGGDAKKDYLDVGKNNNTKDDNNNMEVDM